MQAEPTLKREMTAQMQAKAQRKHASAAPQIVMLHHQLSVPIEMSVFQPLCACDGGEASNALQECYVSN